LTNWVVHLARLDPPSEVRANLYGVVLYTDAHAHVAKALSDPYYWKALSERSGHQWIIYAAKGARGRYEVPAPRPGTLAMLRAVWREPAENRELLEAFRLESTERLPAFAIFAEGEEGTIEQTVVRLSDASVEAAYDSLRSVVDLVSDALRQVEAEHLQEGTRAFYAVRYAVKGYREREVIRQTLSMWGWLRSHLYP
jgi:hypothetical protein